ncbi:MAG TPA: acyltransferase [Chitinophagales bacterium]|nr:acyltransferase [Chitinophagales bacterium]HQO89573.1 acyltransferase [Chitinophagales bacterium]
MERKNENKYFEQFDGARGLLAFSIFILHLHFTYIKVPSTLANFTLHSFFVASAYLITTILLRDKQKYVAFGSFFKQFYIKRILRIFPVYFGYIFVVLVLAILHKMILRHDLVGVLTEFKQYGYMLMTFTYNFKDLYCITQGDNSIASSNLFPHLWSISMEEQFYIIIPFLIYFLSVKSLRILSICCILLFPIIRIVGYEWLKSISDNNLLIGFTMIRSSVFQFDAFFYGILMAVLPPLNLKQIRRLFYLSVGLLIFQDIVNVLIIQSEYNIPAFEMISRYDIYAMNGAARYIDVLLNISCFAFLYLVFNTQNEFPLLLNNRLVEYGKFSFGSYVYQYIFILPSYYLLFKTLEIYLPVFVAELISAIICLVCIIQFSKWSYYRFELKFIKMKDYFLKKI